MRKIDFFMGLGIVSGLAAVILALIGILHLRVGSLTSDHIQIGEQCLWTLMLASVGASYLRQGRNKLVAGLLLFMALVSVYLIFL
ncbi:MAG: hypothetical protein ACM3MK_11670 [Chitinophagales bacterium]